MQLNDVGMVETRQQGRFVGEILGPDDEFAGVGAHGGTETFQRQDVGVANRRCRVGGVGREGIRISRGDDGVASGGGAIAVGLRCRGNLGDAASLSQIEDGAEVVGACEGQCVHLTVGGIFLLTVFVGVTRTTLGVTSSCEIETAAPLSSLGIPTATPSIGMRSILQHPRDLKDIAKIATSQILPNDQIPLVHLRNPRQLLPIHDADDLGLILRRDRPVRLSSLRGVMAVRRGDAHGGIVVGVVRVGIVGGGGGGARQDGGGASLFGQSGVAVREGVGIFGEEFLFETEEGAFSGVFGDLLFGDLLLVLDGGGFGLVGLLGVIGLVRVRGEIGLRRLKGLHRLMGVLGIDGRSHGRTGLRRIGRARSLCRVIVLHMTLLQLPLLLLPLFVNVNGPTGRRRIRLFRNAILISPVPPVRIPSRRVRIHFRIPPAAAAATPPMMVRAPSPDAGVTRAGITPRPDAGGHAAHAGPRRGRKIRAPASDIVVRGSRPHADVPVDAGSVVRCVRFVLPLRHGDVRFGRPRALLLGDADEVGGRGVGGSVVGGAAADVAVSMGFGRRGRGFFGFGFGGGKRCFHCGWVGF